MLGASISAGVASIVWAWERAKYADEEKRFLQTDSEAQGLFLKALFILSRYTIALTLIFHICYFALLSVYYPNISRRHCQGALLYETLSTYFFMGLLNLIMIVRIYALFNRNIAMTALLAILFTGWMFCSIYSVVVYFPKQTFTGKCQQTSVITEALYFIASTHLGIQLTFVLLTFGRTISLKRALRGEMTLLRLIGPLLKRLTRDSWMILAFAIVSAVSTIMWPTDAKFNHNYNFTEMIFPFYILMISSGGCRLILHNRRVVSNQPPPLTAVGSLDSTWTANIEMEEMETESRRIDGLEISTS